MNRGAITVARDLVPLRPLRYSEALRVAELQASRFLEVVGVHEPSVPERVIAELPRFQVTRMTPFPVSGATHWSAGRWLVVLNGAEPITRQRFSLAHELKHVIDHRFADLIYSRFPAEDRTATIEQVCDYFAGCLLMPRPWVKRAWCGGTQHLPELAKTFGVSQAAIQVRLNQIGLTEPTKRCATPGVDIINRAMESEAQPTMYFRSAAALAS